MDSTWRFLPLFMWRFQNKSSRLGACILVYKLAKVFLHTCVVVGQLVPQSTYRDRVEIGAYNFVRDGRYSERGWACILVLTSLS
jgi:hypothetical protein